MNLSKKTQLKYINKSKQKNKQLRRECMSLWAEIGKIRANYKCEYPNCYKTTYLNAHHVFSRSNNATRYDPDNCLILCSGHHTLLTDSAHKDPSFIMKITGQIEGYKAIRTPQWFTLLRIKANTVVKLDLRLELIYLQTMLNNMK